MCYVLHLCSSRVVAPVGSLLGTAGVVESVSQLVLALWFRTIGRVADGRQKVFLTVSILTFAPAPFRFSMVISRHGHVYALLWLHAREDDGITAPTHVFEVGELSCLRNFRLTQSAGQLVQSDLSGGGGGVGDGHKHSETTNIFFPSSWYCLQEQKEKWFTH